MKEEKDIFNYLNKKETSVPDASYFENMADNIIVNETQQPKVIPLFKKPTFWMVAVAASLALILMLNIPTTTEDNVLLALNDISTSEVEGYISQNITDFDSDLITEFIAEENIEEPVIETQYEIKPTVTEEPSLELDDIDSDEILEYFNAEEIDIYEEDYEPDFDELYI